MHLRTVLFAFLSGIVAGTAAAPASSNAPGYHSGGCTYNETAVSKVAKTSQLAAAPLDSGRVAAAWYPSWQAATHPPESLPWSKYDVVTFSFATTTPDSAAPLTLDADSQALLPKFVEQAKQHGVRALVSLGGWTGSIHFSDHVSTESGRTALVKAVVDLANQYSLDGIDFDWEYPGKLGIGCNKVSPEDSANFLKFMQELRQDSTGSQLLLTAAVGMAPWDGPDGQPLTDVSAFAEVFDYLAIMAYDVWGTWSETVGPNAPLDDSCAASPAGSAAKAVAAWTAAKFPADQLVLGVPTYGRAYHVSSNPASSGNISNPYVPFDASQHPLGEGETGEPTTDQCGVTTSGGTGLYNFAGLVSAGYLTDSGTPADGVVYTFDSCSQTPFVYQASSNTMVTYDDAASMSAKGRFIAEKGLKGFAMWHAIGDHNDILLDAVHQGQGQ